jgi:CRISPR locus-related DNA-binding protein
LKTLVAVLGFEESIIISAALRHKLEPGDRLVILTPRDQEDNRAEAAKRRLQGFVQQVGVGKPWLELSMIPVSEHDLERTILELISFLYKEASEGYEIIIEISGGLRVLCLALILASIIANNRLKGIYTVTEHTRKLVKLPKLKVRPHLSPALQELMITILELKEPSLEQLAISLGKDLSTISRQVTKLGELGLLTREGLRPTRVKPTLLGKALRIFSSE